jgi:hypothetical protein
MLKAVLAPNGAPWTVAAVLAGAALFLSSAAMAAAYGVVATTLSIGLGDLRYLGIASTALVSAIVLSLGHYLRVVANYLHAVAYWRRNRRQYGAHPVRDSPVYGSGARRAIPIRAGFLGGNVAQQLLRLIGENPFLLALPFAPRGFAPWGPRLWLWAACLGALSLVATVLPPLRAFGPGRSYMKAGVFPTAYTLAFGIGTLQGIVGNRVGIVTLACLGFSLGAIWFFYAYVRGRETEQTATTPPALADAVKALRALPPGGVFVLPYMYADYVCYHTGRPVLWGGHCGDLARFAWIAPVITRPLDELMRELGARYVLLDTAYVRPEELRLRETGRPPLALGPFRLFDVVADSHGAAELGVP